MVERLGSVWFLSILEMFVIRTPDFSSKSPWVIPRLFLMRFKLSPKLIKTPFASYKSFILPLQILPSCYILLISLLNY